MRNQLKSPDGMDRRFYGSITTGITNQLVFAEYPDVAQFITMTPDSEIVNEVLDPNTDIFLNIPQHIAEDYPALVRAILGSVLIAAQLIEQPEAPRAQRLILIDEAAKLGRMDTLADIRDRGRAIGLHLMMVHQTPGEMVRIWGEAGATSWRDGCSAVVTGPATARTSATDMSTMLGTKTIRVMTESRSTSNQMMTPVSGSISKSEQEQLRDVPLLSPTEIAKLPRHASTITSPGFKPILATKAISFTRLEMASPVRTSEEIADKLQVTKTRQAFLERTGIHVTDPEGSNDDQEESEEMNRSETGEETLGSIKEDSNRQADSEDDEPKREAREHETYSASDVEHLDIEEDHAVGKDEEEVSVSQNTDAPTEGSPKGKSEGQEPFVDGNADEENSSKSNTSTVADTDESSLETSKNDIPISASTTGEDKATNWENEECNTLIRGITKGKTLAEVAALVKRTETDVLRKAENLRKSGVIGEKLMQGLRKELERDPNAEP